MKKILCPTCGQPMIKTATVDTVPGGKKVAIYVCPNKYKCGTVCRVEL